MALFTIRTRASELVSIHPVVEVDFIALHGGLCATCVNEYGVSSFRGHTATVDKNILCGINNIQSCKLVFCVQYFFIFTPSPSSESLMFIFKTFYIHQWLNPI